MNNIYTFAKSTIRNNPGFAVAALSLDAIVGIIAATVAYLIYNMVDFSVTMALVVTVSGLFAVTGLLMGAYGYLATRGELRSNDFWDENDG